MVLSKTYRAARVIYPDKWFSKEKHAGRPADPHFNELRVPRRAREEPAGAVKILEEKLEGGRVSYREIREF